MSEQMQTIVSQYLQLANANKIAATDRLVDWLTHEQRIELRQHLESIGCRKLLKSLYYDYQKQVWIK